VMAIWRVPAGPRVRTRERVPPTAGEVSVGSPPAPSPGPGAGGAPVAQPVAAAASPTPSRPSSVRRSSSWGGHRTPTHANRPGPAGPHPRGPRFAERDMNTPRPPARRRPSPPVLACTAIATSAGSFSPTVSTTALPAPAVSSRASRVVFSRVVFSRRRLARPARPRSPHPPRQRPRAGDDPPDGGLRRWPGVPPVELGHSSAAGTSATQPVIAENEPCLPRPRRHAGGVGLMP